MGGKAEEPVGGRLNSHNRSEGKLRRPASELTRSL